MKRRTVFLIVLTALLITAFLGWFFIDEFTAPTIAPFQETTGWRDWKRNVPESERYEMLWNPYSENLVTILLRTDFSGQRLLIKLNHSDELYLYDAATKSIREATVDEWENSSGETTVCTKQHGDNYPRSVTWEDSTAQRNGRLIATHGKYTRGAIDSPSHSQVAILSAYGPRKPSIPGIGMGSASDPVFYGRRYLEIMKLDSRESLTQPVRLNRGVGSGGQGICWSGNEKFLVAYSWDFENFSVIETGVSAP